MVGVASKIDTICTVRGLLLGIPGSHLLFPVLSVFPLRPLFFPTETGDNEARKIRGAPFSR